MRLKEKTALITGGARGIGAATALLFLREGARCRDCRPAAEGMKEVAGKARSEGYEIETFAGDITKKDEVDRIVTRLFKNWAASTFWSITPVLSSPGHFFEKTVADWEKTLSVNLIGLFLCCQAATKVYVAAEIRQDRQYFLHPGD